MNLQKELENKNKLPVGIWGWVTQFSMGFRWTIEVKSRSTTLWPFHWPGPSKIKGENGGKSVIKSKTLIVNFPLCHYCTGTHTHIHSQPHPSCNGGHDPMYQYQERNEGEDAWPLKAIADHFQFCVHKSLSARSDMMCLKVQMYGWKIYKTPLPLIMESHV